MPKHLKRLVIAVACVALACSTLAACSGNPAEDLSQRGEIAGDLRVVVNWTGAEGEAFAAIIAAFEDRHPEVTVTIEPVPFNQTLAQLTQEYVSGNPPDISIATPGIMKLLADQGLLLDLTDQWESWTTSGEYGDVERRLSSSTGGAPSAVPFKSYVATTVWYNPHTLKDLGLEVPQTWDEMLAAMDAAKAAGLDPIANGGQDGWPTTDWLDTFLVRVAGNEVFEALQKNEISWDDPAVVQAMNVTAEVFGTYLPTTTLGKSFTDASCDLVGGNALFQNNGSFMPIVYSGSCGEDLQPGVDYDFFAVPTLDPTVTPTQVVNIDLMVGAKSTKNPAATKALLAWLGSADAQEIWVERGGFIAPNAEVPLNSYPNELMSRNAALWPRDGVALVFDLDDYIGGEFQAGYWVNIQKFVQTLDVDEFVASMVSLAGSTLS